MTRGRPLRFLALLLGGWTIARVVALMPADAPPPVTHAIPPKLASVPAPVPLAPQPVVRELRLAWTAGPTRPSAKLPPSRAAPALTPTFALPTPGITFPRPLIPTPVPEPIAAPRQHQSSRLRIDAWLIARGRGGAALLTPQLGGSQAGVRAVYALSGPSPFVRAATPINPRFFVSGVGPLGPGPAEAAFGVQQAIPRAPVTVYVELRKLAGQSVAPVVGGFGGIDHRVGDFRVSGYGQGGYAAGRAATFFADGQLAASYDLRRLGPATLSAGVGAWGAAQRGASRLDLGPGLGLRHGNVRIGLDYRVRVAGDARPGSGPALTIAAGF